MYKNIALVFILYLIGFHAFAAEETQIRNTNVSHLLYFKPSEDKICLTHKTNVQTWSQISLHIQEIRKNYRIHSIVIHSGASLEGSTAYNSLLSLGRAHSIQNLLCRYFGFSDTLFIIHSHGEDWKRLGEMIKETDIPAKKEILEILGQDSLIRETELKRLHDGKAWEYMMEYVFPELRYGSVTFHISSTINPIEPQKSLCATQDVKFSPAILADKTGYSRKRIHFYLRTNLLYDVLLIPNLGAELSIYRKWSVILNWMYSWWHNDNTHFYWRTYGGDIELRRYFRTDRKDRCQNPSGHHLGLFGQMLTYDFELGGRGYLGDRWSWSCGVVYGYTLPIISRLSLDFSLSLGYFTGLYEIYDPNDNRYVWKETRRRHWIGPVKAELALVWQIGKIQ